MRAIAIVSVVYRKCTNEVEDESYIKTYKGYAK